LALKKETIKDQFTAILKKVTLSHPMEWGDKSYEAKELITDFQGNTDSLSPLDNLSTGLKGMVKEFFGMKQESLSEEYLAYLDLAKKSAVDSREIKINYLYNKAFKSGNDADSMELSAELHHRNVVDTLFKEIALRLKLKVLGEKNDNIQFECLRNSVNHFKLVCQNFSEYTLKYVQYLSIACKNNTSDVIRDTITDVCEGI